MSTTEDHTEPITEEKESQKHPRYNVDRWHYDADPSEASGEWVQVATYVEVPDYRQDIAFARRRAIELATQDLDLEMQYGTFRLTPLREGEAKVHTRTQVLQDDWS